MAQHGKRSPRIFLVGLGARPGPDDAAASVLVVMSIADGSTCVNAGVDAVGQVRPSRDLGGRPEWGSGARHTDAMWTADSVAHQLWGRLTTERAGVDRPPAGAIPATSALDSSDPQYRAKGQARIGGLRLLRNARGVLESATEIGVDMPLQCAVEDRARLAAGTDPGADSADVRPMTGVDAA